MRFPLGSGFKKTAIAGNRTQDLPRTLAGMNGGRSFKQLKGTISTRLTYSSSSSVVLLVNLSEGVGKS